jgi:hypothetical protein
LISLFRQFPADGLARLRPRASQRAVAVVLALVVEALLVLAILSLGLVDQTPPKRPPGLVSVDIAAPPQAEPERARPEAASKASPLQQTRDVPPVPVPSAAPVIEPPPAIVPLSWAVAQPAQPVRHCQPAAPAHRAIRRAARLWSAGPGRAGRQQAGRLGPQWPADVCRIVVSRTL